MSFGFIFTANLDAMSRPAQASNTGWAGLSRLWGSASYWLAHARPPGAARVSIDSKLESAIRFGPVIPACVPRPMMGFGNGSEETGQAKPVIEAGTKTPRSAEADFKMLTSRVIH